MTAPHVFGIRHLSPAGAWYVREYLDEADPELVLAEDNGITITASEVYSDGYSVYLAAEIKSEKGGFNNIPSHYTRRFEETVSQSVFAGGTWSVDGGKEEHLSNSYFEGKAVDDHTFIGMMKLDQQQYSEADGTLNLKISDIYYDDISEEVSESIEPANRFGGAWNLSVPYSVDKQHCREISVNQKNKDGYGIEKVFVSPYQVIVMCRQNNIMSSMRWQCLIRISSRWRYGMVIKIRRYLPCRVVRLQSCIFICQMS